VEAMVVVRGAYMLPDRSRPAVATTTVEARRKDSSNDRPETLTQPILPILRVLLLGIR